MNRSDIKWCVLRIEGTNSEDESVAVLQELGVQAEAVHLKQLTGDDVTDAERRHLGDYHGLWIAGGFSAGDYIRAGAILAARMKARLGPELEAFVAAGKPVLGICNGFQILTELGMLPNVEGGGAFTEAPTAALHLNDSGHYECRPSLLRKVGNGLCKFTTTLGEGEMRTMISSHAEGKFVADDATLRRMREQGQIVLQYTDPDGAGEPGYPWSPNGSMDAIAGVCNPQGTVFGMMPHPERVFWRHNHPDWTRTGLDAGLGYDVGDGRALFEAIVAYQEALL